MIVKSTEKGSAKRHEKTYHNKNNRNHYNIMMPVQRIWAISFHQKMKKVALITHFRALWQISSKKYHNRKVLLKRRKKSNEWSKFLKIPQKNDISNVDLDIEKDIILGQLSILELEKHRWMIKFWILQNATNQVFKKLFMNHYQFLNQLNLKPDSKKNGCKYCERFTQANRTMKEFILEKSHLLVIFVITKQVLTWQP